MIELLKIAFQDGYIPSEFSKGLFVLIHNPGYQGFWGVALLETVYKIISTIIYSRLMASKQFHKKIHGFCTKRVTGVAIMNVKLMMQIAKRNLDPLFAIPLDIKKAYNTLDRDWTMKVFKDYGAGERTCRILGKIWNEDMIPKKTDILASISKLKEEFNKEISL